MHRNDKAVILTFLKMLTDEQKLEMRSLITTHGQSDQEFNDGITRLTQKWQGIKTEPGVRSLPMI